MVGKSGKKTLRHTEFTLNNKNGKSGFTLEDLRCIIQQINSSEKIRHFEFCAGDIKISMDLSVKQDSYTTIMSETRGNVKENAKPNVSLELDNLTSEQREQLEELDREYLSITDPLAYETALIDSHIEGNKL